MTETTVRGLRIALLCIVFPAASFAVPHINSLSPTSGAWNSSVTISGTGFGTGRGSVTFNGKMATITSWTGGSSGMVVVTDERKRCPEDNGRGVQQRSVIYSSVFLCRSTVELGGQYAV
jgi:hypothetical protein